jgi:hypothetical protein
MLLRAAGAQGVDFQTFQDDFDLDKDRQPGVDPRNNFTSVAGAIRQRYPHIQIRIEDFPKGAGAEKLACVEEKLNNQQLILIALNMEPLAGRPVGWHIMPVVDMDEDNLVLVYVIHLDGRPELIQLPKAAFIAIHENFPGGGDVAYLD